VNAHAIGCDPAYGASETGNQKRDVMAARCEPAKHLVQVDLGAAGPRILPILPVRDDELQERS
jgi:hypothetical protein